MCRLVDRRSRVCYPCIHGFEAWHLSVSTHSCPPRRRERRSFPQRVRQIMRHEYSVPCRPRPFRVTTAPDVQDSPSMSDPVERRFTADRPGVKGVAQITYILTWHRFIYFATVIDCYATEVAGWPIANHMRTGFVSERSRTPPHDPGDEEMRYKRCPRPHRGVAQQQPMSLRSPLHLPTASLSSVTKTRIYCREFTAQPTFCSRP